MRKRAAIDILQLTTNGHSMRDTAGTNSSLVRELAEKMRGRFPFHGRIGRKNQLPHESFIEDRFQVTDAKLSGRIPSSGDKCPIRTKIARDNCPIVQ